MMVAMMPGVSAVVESVVARFRTILVVVVIVFLHGIVDENIGRRRG